MIKLIAADVSRWRPLALNRRTAVTKLTVRRDARISPQRVSGFKVPKGDMQTFSHFQD